MAFCRRWCFLALVYLTSNVNTHMLRETQAKEVSLRASMNTAKEVGGDFYDYFTIDDHHICFLIADVSGKGTPAALFMMTAKTMIKF